MARLNKHVKDARKSCAARYLQLKSGHTITAAHLMRIGKAEDARCWWCSGSIQTVAHLLLECRKWRRERESMVQKLKAKDITVSETPDRRNLKILFEDNTIVDMLEFVEQTEVGKRPGAENDKVDSWDAERLDQGNEDEEGAVENRGE
jgi:hypothetical protein